MREVGKSVSKREQSHDELLKFEKVEGLEFLADLNVVCIIREKERKANRGEPEEKPR
jgi:hypothetical protein